MGKIFKEKMVLEIFRKNISQKTLFRSTLIISSNASSKKQLVTQIASMLLCMNEKPPCRVCSACEKVKTEIHPDLFWIGPEDKKSIPIEKIRGVIKEASTKPWESRYKVFILEEIDHLREEAANALLKILEEPPETCIFILTAANENNIIHTVLSRCQIFSLDQISEDTLEILVNKHGIEYGKAKVAITLCEGSVENALYLIKEEWENRAKVLRSFYTDLDPVEAGESFAHLCGTGEAGRKKGKELVLYIATFWHDVLISCYSPENSEFIINSDLQNAINEISKEVNPMDIYKFLDFLFQSRKMIDGNINLSLIAENIFLEAKFLRGLSHG